MMRTAAFIALSLLALPLAAADSSGSKQQQAKSNETTSAPAEATEKAAPPALQAAVLGGGSGPESPLVAAARSVNRGNKSTIVITNSTLVNNTGGHFSVAPGAPVLKTAREGAGTHRAPGKAKPPEGTVTDDAEARAKAEKAKLEQVKAEIAKLEAEKARRTRMAQASEELLDGNGEALEAVAAAAAKEQSQGQQPTETPAKPPL